MMNAVYVVVIIHPVQTVLVFPMVMLTRIIAEPVIMTALMTVCRTVPESGVVMQRFLISIMTLMEMDLVQAMQ